MNPRGNRTTVSPARADADESSAPRRRARASRRARLDATDRTRTRAPPPACARRGETPVHETEACRRGTTAGGRRCDPSGTRTVTGTSPNRRATRVEVVPNLVAVTPSGGEHERATERGRQREGVAHRLTSKCVFVEVSTNGRLVRLAVGAHLLVARETRTRALVRNHEKMTLGVIARGIGAPRCQPVACALVCRKRTRPCRRTGTSCARCTARRLPVVRGDATARNTCGRYRRASWGGRRGGG